LAILTQNEAISAEKNNHSSVFPQNRQFYRRKLVTIAQKSGHDIDSGMSKV
jgi:hypothetical protein